MKTCRFCNTELTNVFCDLGHQPPSNSFLTREQLEEPEVTYPLKVMVCHKCFLVQLPETKKASEIFVEDYPYYSSQSPANVSHAKAYVEMMCERFGYGKKSRIIEIGSNDGYLLKHFRNHGCTWSKTLGIEPASGAAEEARSNGVYTAIEYFNSRTAKQWKQADLICSINTIAHQPDINSFVAGIKIALAPDGVTTHEFPHLMRTVEGCQLDQVYLEHFNYYSLATICEIFEKHGLEVFDVDEIPEHGGSLRIYARHYHSTSDYLARSNDIRVGTVKHKEKQAGMLDLSYYQDFQPRIESIKTDIVRFLVEKKQAGISVAAYGAAAKASTFFNFCGIRSDLIPYVIDRSPHKAGKYMPGSHIPIVDESVLKRDQPEYILITAWNLAEEIMDQLSYIREWDGKFLVAIPEMRVI